jgi:hypothetical protein
MALLLTAHPHLTGVVLEQKEQVRGRKKEEEGGGPGGRVRGARMDFLGEGAG